MLGAAADVAGLRAEEEVGDKLNSVDLGLVLAWCWLKLRRRYMYHCEKPIDPPVSNIVRYKTGDEGSHRDTACDHQSPNPNIPRSLLLEESLRHNRTTNGSRWADEESHNGTAHSHSRIRRRLSTPDIPHQTANQGDEEQRATAIGVGEWLPKQWCDSENGDLERSQVGD